MTSKLRNRSPLFFLGLIVFVVVTASTAFADCPIQAKLARDTPFHLLVIGDSIMWGQGLREEEKFSARVKCWLEEKTNREVKVHREAHSGAVISNVSLPLLPFKARSGEVNLDTPTINEQLDQAIQFYRDDRSSPSLILMNGCINDVGVKNLLTAYTPLEDVRKRVRKSCNEDMYSLLQRVRKSFPAAYVLVTGYYPIVSPLTADNAFIRLLVKSLNNRIKDAPKLSDKEARQRLITISNEWYKASTANLIEAVAKTNAESGSDPATAKVIFVEIQFGPEHVFAAPDTLLWNFIFGSTNLSGFRKVIVIVTFGTAAYKANDHVRDSRIKSCEETFKKPKGAKEDKEQEDRRKDLFLICRYASLGHPNQMGALIYTEAIKGQLQFLVDRAGWRLDPNRHLTLQRKDPNQ